MKRIKLSIEAAYGLKDALTELCPDPTPGGPLGRMEYIELAVGDACVSDNPVITEAIDVVPRIKAYIIDKDGCEL